MPVYRMTLAYDGTRYHGWQIQPRKQETIQGFLQEALTRLCGQKIKIMGSGRTDAGVHARGQVASFLLQTSPKSSGHLLTGLNALLPVDIRVLALRRAPEGFNARTWATRKTYTYTLAAGPVLSPFDRLYCTHIRRPPDYAKIREALAEFKGVHDFKSFQGAGSDVRDTVRNIMRASLRVHGPYAIITLEANGFLRYMVRNIVGTLLEIGRNRVSVQAIPAILDAQERQAAGPTAPPQGLCLEKVIYGNS